MPDNKAEAISLELNKQRDKAIKINEIIHHLKDDFPQFASRLDDIADGNVLAL